MLVKLTVVGLWWLRSDLPLDLDVNKITKNIGRNTGIEFFVDMIKDAFDHLQKVDLQ